METRFYDLSPSSYPFMIEFISEKVGQVVHALVVDGPGGVLTRPDLPDEYAPYWVRISWPDGEVIEC